MTIARPRQAASSEARPERGSAWLGWLPLLVIGAGLAFGVVLWARWGFLVAFEAVRAYCL